jgi:hypothetical protein
LKTQSSIHRDPRTVGADLRRPFLFRDQPIQQPRALGLFSVGHESHRDIRVTLERFCDRTREYLVHRAVDNYGLGLIPTATRGENNGETGDRKSHLKPRYFPLTLRLSKCV